jgi:hypothetical protein
VQVLELIAVAGDDSCSGHCRDRQQHHVGCGLLMRNGLDLPKSEASI